MKQIKKIKFYQDKDGREWTIKVFRIMTIKDIRKIIDLYRIQKLSKNQIQLRKDVKYSKKRLRILIQKFNWLLDIT